MTILKGDCRDILRSLPSESVHCVVTSPPYWGLRDYGVEGQIGLENDFADYIEIMVNVFAEVRRILRADGTLWLNLGDCYAGSGRGGNPTAATSTLQGSLASQEASMVKRTRTRTEIGATARDAAQTNFSRRVTRGSQLAAGFHETVRQNGDIGRAWAPPPNGFKQKDLMGMPWRVAFALQADGWWLRQDIIWSKPNPMPESVSDRCTKAHEYLFLLSKSERYHYDADAIRTPFSGETKAGLLKHAQKPAADVPDGANKRSVWTVATEGFPEAHFATFPPALIEPCILAGCPLGGTVLDPFGGSGTTGIVADRLGYNATLIELNLEYAAMAERRIKNDAGMFADVQCDAHISNESGQR